MQKDHLASAYGTPHCLLDVGCRLPAPVVGGDAPHHRHIASPPSLAQNQGLTAAVGRAEKTQMLACGIPKRALAFLQFHTHGSRRAQYKQRVCLRMVSDFMPSLGYGTGNIR